MLRIDYTMARLHQAEMLRSAERARLANRVYRPEQGSEDRRIALRLRTLFPPIATRQA